MKSAAISALGGLKISEYSLILDGEVRNYGGGLQVLVFSTRSGILLAVPAAAWKNLAGACAEPVSPDLVAQLEAAEILVPADQVEYEYLARESRHHSANSKTLLRVILPTFQCNLGCVYCGQSHNSREISTALSEQLVSEIEGQLRTGTFENVQITWFGGEPSTAPEPIRQLSAAFLDVCARYNVKYRARMVTNGVALSKARAAEFYLRDRILAFDISLDGPKDVHDRRRPLRGTGSSYDKIIANLKAITSEPELAGCELSIRVNIDQENAPFIPMLIDDLAARGLAPRVRLYFALVVEWNPERRKELLSRQEFADMEVAWLVRAIEAGFSPALLPKRRFSACLAGETSSTVVAADGTVHNCTMTPIAGHAITATTRPLGSLGEDVSAEQHERHDKIFRRLDATDLECRSCRFLFLCQGGCPKELDAGELPCPSFKFNMGSRMLLQYAGMSAKRKAPRLVDFTHGAS